MSTWGIITAGDVQAEQARTLASAQGTDQGVQGCAALDAPTRAAWQTFLAALTVWCQTPMVNVWTPWIADNAVVVTGDTGNTMLAWESALTAWQQRLSGPCPKTSPNLATFNPNPAGEQATQWLRWGAVIVGFAATAYIVGSLTRFIPTPAPRAPAAPAPKQLPAAAKDNPLPYRSRLRRLERRAYR